MTRIVLAGAEVFDGSGADPRKLDIAIEDERIAQIGTGLDGDERLDLVGASILPGLIDCHVHVVLDDADLLNWVSRPFSYQFFRAAENLRTTLHAGITTVRDAAGADLGIKQAVDDGLIEGPRMQLSINMISQTGGHNDLWNVSGITAGLSTPHPGMPDGVADGEAEVRKLARLMLRAGAGVLKVASTGGVLSPRDHPSHAHFSLAELKAIVEEAEAVGVSVMAHAQGTTGIRNAILAGVRSIEHGVYLDDETIELMLEHEVWLVPTLMAPLAVLEAAEQGVRIEESQLEKCRLLLEEHSASFRRAFQAGVRIAMGTDSGLLGHGDNLRELALMGSYGMAPAEVLRAATSSAAELLGMQDQLGSIAPGLFADLLILSPGADPYDLGALPGAIDQVWKGGKPISRR